MAQQLATTMSKAKQFALTTFDNPFNPFTDFASWYSFDKEHEYDSSEKLMRIANLTDEMTDIEENNEIERAIDRIIELDFQNIYKKVSQEIAYPDT